jgi:alpha-galactosidase
VDIKSAGLNHFIWLLDIRDKATGEDLYPALRTAVASAPASLEPFSLELFRIFGYCPIAGDTHLVEYLPWLHDLVAQPWARYQVPLYDWGGNEAARDFVLVMMQALVLQTLLLDPMINDISRARAILDDYLARFAAYLPQF